MKRVQKSLKNVEKYFQPQFWKIRHARNIKKIRPNERGGQTHLLRIYFFVFYECHLLQNLCRIKSLYHFTRFLHPLN